MAHEDAYLPHHKAIEITPDRPEPLNNLAWRLAATPHADLRNGPEAVRLAAHACELTGYTNALCLDTLAAAYAEAGRFDDAIQVLKRVIAQAGTAQNQQLMDELERKLKLYEAGRPYRDTP